MILIQIFLIAFAGFAAWRTISRFKTGYLSRGAVIMWLLFWVVVAIAVAIPKSTSWFATLVGVGRGVDAVIYVSIIVIFYLIFRLFLRLEKIEHNITLLVREFGLRSLENKDDEK